MRTVKKNYGVMRYSTRPTSKHYAEYLADIFDLRTDSRVKKKINISVSSPVKYMQERIANAVRGVFLEKQLLKHGRKRLCEGFDLTPFKDCETLQEIADRMIEIQEKAETAHDNAWQDFKNAQKKENNQKETSEAYDKYSKCGEQLDKLVKEKVDLGRAYKDVFNASKRTSPNYGQLDTSTPPKSDETEGQKLARMIRREQWSKDQSVPAYIRELAEDEDTQDMFQEIENTNAPREQPLPAGRSLTPPKLEFDEQGGIVHDDLNKVLSKILDDIVGQSEVRAMERGYNRPSRFGHFIKGAFLPVYKANKQHKRPAFYIDTSGSMEGKRGRYPCASSAVAGFLRSRHRKLSELRPRYYSFTSYHTVEKFDIMTQLPRACGGTSVDFLSALRDNEKSIIITDAEFDSRDFAVLRVWAEHHPNAEVNWIVNQRDTYNSLKQTLKGLGKHRVWYTMF